MKATVLNLVRSLSTEVLIEILFQMGESHPETFSTLIEKKSPRTVLNVRVPNSTIVVHLTNAEFDELKVLGSKSDKYIVGIKRLREITGLGLKEAKDLFEQNFDTRQVKTLGDLVREQVA